jgi:hypothetical protein
VVAFVLSLGLAEAAAFLTRAAGNQRVPSSTTARLGGLLFLWFHHVTLEFGADLLTISGNTAFHFTLALALLAGTVSVLLLLVSAGRRTAAVAGGSSLLRGVHGAKVAVPYAGLCLATGVLLRSSTKVFTGSADSSVSLRPALVSAALWPLALALVAGFAGGLRSAPVGDRLRDRRLRGALAGGWRMLWLGLVLSFGGLLVMAVVMPSATQTYLQSAFTPGVLQGMVVIAFTLLVLPNMTAWILYPAMGSCVGVFHGLSGTCALSYTRFPSASGHAITIGGFGGFGGYFTRVPVAYFGFLLVPAIAVVAGGRLAARRSAAASNGEAVTVGALAGVMFALLSAGLIVVASITVRTGTSVAGPGSVRFGPDLLVGPALALVWGAAGGAVGGLFARAPRVRTTGTTEGGPVGTDPPSEES